MYNIYVLKCPLINEVVYVGKTKLDLDKRLYNHLSDKSNKRKREWILNLKSQKLTPIIELVQTCDDEVADITEYKLINYYKIIKTPLLNGRRSDGFKMIQITIQLSEEVVREITKEVKKTKKPKQVIIDERLKKSYAIKD